MNDLNEAAYLQVEVWISAVKIALMSLLLKLL